MKNAVQYGAVECTTVQSAIPFHSVCIGSDIYHTSIAYLTSPNEYGQKTIILIEKASFVGMTGILDPGSLPVYFINI